MTGPRTPARRRLALLCAWCAVTGAAFSCVAGFMAGGWHIAFGMGSLCIAGCVATPIIRRRRQA
jgi:hypothetical protein